MDVRRMRVTLLCVVGWAVAVTVLCPCHAQAQRSRRGAGSATFKPGDQVEVTDGFEKVTGVVVSIDANFGRIQVRWDDASMKARFGDRLSQMPARARERFSLRSYSADELRLLKSGKLEESPKQSAPTQPESVRAAQETSRLWRDKTGKFSVQATFKGIDGDKVVLVTEAGKEIAVPLEKLGADDAAYATNASKRNGGQVATGSVAASGLAAHGESGIGMTTPDLKGAKVLSPKSFDKWTFVPEGVQASSVPSVATVALSHIPESQSFFESTDGLYVGADGRRAIVQRQQGKVGDGRVYLERIDTLQSQSEGLVELPEKTEVLDVATDTSMVAYHATGFRNDDAGTLTIARIENDALQEVMRWQPHRERSRARVDAAWFLSDDRILTQSRSGNAMTVWAIKNAKALAHIPVKTAVKISLSPDRRYMAIAMPSGIAIIDMKSLSHVATVPIEAQSIQNLVFSSDNQRLAASIQGGMMAWDLATGKLINKIAKIQTGFAGEIHWAGNYLLVNDQYLYDVERRIILWEYQGLDSSRGASSRFQNGLLWVASKANDDRDASLSAYAIPHPAAIQLADELGAPEDLLVAKPGDSVAIQVDIDSSLGSDNVVRDSIANNLREAGYEVAENADLIVQATCKPLPTQTIKINTGASRFDPRPEEIVERTISPHESSLVMTYRGEVVWRRGGLAKPGFLIMLQEGETLDQALDRLTKPNLELLTTSKFDTHVTRPGSASPSGAYGLSQVISGQLTDKIGAGGTF